MSLKGSTRSIFFLLLVTAIMFIVTRTSAARVPKGDDGLWISKLPRGPVPPSGPSPCHNMLDPYSQSQYVSPQHQDQIIICP
ncbi:hypothetical protein HanIR_Chr12g0575221 [Helianthus annuus]|nr:hypothetical protein HanIR_Chr12g0575221 [Helianthus annuus]